MHCTAAVQYVHILQKFSVQLTSSSRLLVPFVLAAVPLVPSAVVDADVRLIVCASPRGNTGVACFQSPGVSSTLLPLCDSGVVVAIALSFTYSAYTR
jgi:hypothetical protein